MGAQNNSFIIHDLEGPLTGVYLSVIVPTYNESENIRWLLEALIATLDAQLPNDYEVIVVDDNSPDQTWKIVQELSSDYPQVQLIRRNDERGLSSAVIRGWQRSRGQFLGVMDGDLQHPSAILPKLIQKTRGNPHLDLVVATRYRGGGGVNKRHIRQRIISRAAQGLGVILLPGVVMRVSDPMSGYFIVRRSAVAERAFKPLGYKILLEVIAKGNIREIQEVGYIFQDRRGGSSKRGLNIYGEYVLQLIQLRLNVWFHSTIVNSCGIINKNNPEDRNV